MLRLFRGTSYTPGQRRRTPGVSWTGSIEIAEMFACRPTNAKFGVVLETTAPASAILYVYKGNDEDEYIVDPYKLGEVTRNY